MAEEAGPSRVWGAVEQWGAMPREGGQRGCDYGRDTLGPGAGRYMLEMPTGREMGAQPWPGPGDKAAPCPPRQPVCPWGAQRMWRARPPVLGRRSWRWWAGHGSPAATCFP